MNCNCIEKLKKELEIYCYIIKYYLNNHNTKTTDETQPIKDLIEVVLGKIIFQYRDIFMEMFSEDEEIREVLFNIINTRERYKKELLETFNKEDNGVV